MTYKGHIQNGVIVLDDTGVKLPEGAEVDVFIRKGVDTADESEGMTLNERFKDIIGACPDLPEDMAENHNHYIHGTPKR